MLSRNKWRNGFKTCKLVDMIGFIFYFFLHLKRKADSSQRDVQATLAIFYLPLCDQKVHLYISPHGQTRRQTNVSCMDTASTAADLGYNFVVHVWNVLLNRFIRHAQNVSARLLTDESWLALCPGWRARLKRLFAMEILVNRGHVGYVNCLTFSYTPPKIRVFG